MKKVMVGLLCMMLAVGTLSGCGSKKTAPEQNQEEANPEKGKEDIKAEPEKEKEEADSEENVQKEEKEANETDEDMTEDLTITVLKEQAGTRDYTSLEELNPEPGSHIAVVVKSTKTGYWARVKKGMEAAVKDLNAKMGYKGDDKIKMSFEGPADETDVEKQIDLIDAVLAENPTVLCLAAIDMQSCEAQLEMAAENDIPVIVLDSGVESGLVNAVCSTDNKKAGEEAAKKMAEALAQSGQIAVMTHVANSETSQEREKGFTEEMAKNHPEIEIVNISHENEETSMQDMADAVLKLYPEVKGYYCTNETAADEVLAAVKASGKEVLVLGFDSGKEQKAAIQDGTELGVIAQNPYGMGYATIVAGARADQGLENDPFINTGFQWIDSSNLTAEEFANYLYD